MKIAPLLGLVLVLSGPVPADADVIVDWNQQVITSGGPQIQRTLAMVHLAMFDAVNAIEPRYSPYLALPAPPPGASPEAAAAAAARGVLVRLFPAQQGALDNLLVTSLAGVPDGQAKDDGIHYGDLVAQAIYQARADDHILDPGPAYVAGTLPGDYQLTSPGPPQPVNTGGFRWVPFALRSGAQFRPNGPAKLTSPQYARDLEEVYPRGAQGALTFDETQIAMWHTEQAQFQFNRIARAEVLADGGTLIQHARLFALLNIALADATTSAFDAKYSFNVWRPSTAIHNADLDDNDRTIADPIWAPFLPTPPHPEYPSAHGVVQAAAAVVMKHYFGPNYSFETTAPSAPGVRRFYQSVDAYIEEGALARILGGMHFRTSIEEGTREGVRVGNWVIEYFLQPLD